MTIILADDSPIQLNIARSVMQKFPQFQVVGAYSNGLDALKALRALKPDAALIDYAMPNLTGAEVIEQARKEGLQTKFVFATSMGQKAAAYAYNVPVVVKPYSHVLVKIALHEAGIL